MPILDSHLHHRLASFVLLGALAVAPAVQAQPALDVPSQIVARKTIKLLPDEFKEFTGFYRMSDGQVLLVKQQANTFLAQLGNRPTMEVRAIAPNIFVTKDGSMQLAFEERHDPAGPDVVVTLAEPA
jgi:hypothetical protein